MSLNLGIIGRPFVIVTAVSSPNFVHLTTDALGEGNKYKGTCSNSFPAVKRLTLVHRKTLYEPDVHALSSDISQLLYRFEMCARNFTDLQSLTIRLSEEIHLSREVLGDFEANSKDLIFRNSMLPRNFQIIQN